MTVPTLYNFTEALQAPDLAFSTLRDCRPRRTATGGVVLSRTSRFAEAEIEWQSRKYLLCFPLSTASIFAVEQTAARLRYLRTPLLTEYTILRDEMTYTDDTGTTRTCDVVLHRLPEGRPLSVCAAEFDAESLRSALDKLEAGLSELGFSHNNLKPFYHKWDDGRDNYLELVQNIYRNFINMKLFRDRVVNKEQCKTM